MLVCSKTIDKRKEHLSRVFRALDTANIRAKKKKCPLCSSSVTYLGHRIGADGLSPLSTNLEKVLIMRSPKFVLLVKVKAERSILSMNVRLCLPTVIGLYL